LRHSQHNNQQNPESREIDPEEDIRRVNNNTTTMNIIKTTIMMRNRQIILKVPNNIVYIKLNHTIRKLEEKVVLITNRNMINKTPTNRNNTVQYREEQVLKSNKMIFTKIISLCKRAVRIRSIEKIIIRKELKITCRRKKKKS